MVNLSVAQAVLVADATSGGKTHSSPTAGPPVQYVSLWYGVYVFPTSGPEGVSDLLRTGVECVLAQLGVHGAFPSRHTGAGNTHPTTLTWYESYTRFPEVFFNRRFLVAGFDI